MHTSLSPPSDLAGIMASIPLVSRFVVFSVVVGCFPLVDVFEDSVQVCCVVGEDQVCGFLRSLGLSPWFATF